MIKHLRNKHVQKQIYIILAIFILPPFLLWGVNLSGKGDKNTGSLGVIDGHKISFKEYLDSYRAAQHQAEFIYGGNLNRLKPFINFKGEAWDRLILLNYAKKHDIRTGDSEVVNWITSQSLFSHRSQFDMDFYKRYVAEYLRMSVRDFEEEVRQLLTIGKVQEKTRAATQVSDAELRTLYDQENGERDIAYGFLAGTFDEKTDEITDAEIQNIYAVVKDRLTAPEQVKLRYVFVPKESAEKFKDALAAKEASIDELSQKYGLEAKETRFFSKNEAVPELTPSKELLFLCFSLPLKKDSVWVPTEKGSYKIQVLEKISERTLSFEEAKDSLKKIAKRQKISQKAHLKLKELRAKITPQNFEETLKSASIEVKHVEKFKKGMPLTGLSPHDGGNVEKAVAELKEGEISEPIEASEGSVLLKVEKNRPADDKKFAEEKETFRKKILDQKTEKAMLAMLEAERKRLVIDLETMKKVFPEEPAS